MLRRTLVRARSLAAAPITLADVTTLQAKWADAIVSISDSYLESPCVTDSPAYVDLAKAAASSLYGYGHHPVLFKPTKAHGASTFRPSPASALAYFIGGPNDDGFAINNGKGFSKVVFNNHAIDLNGPLAIAMGTYAFTCRTSGEVSDVEYTFGYKRCAEDEQIRIFLHHSSIPYAKC